MKNVSKETTKPKKVKCDKCNGTGKIKNLICTTCNGTGKRDLLLD